MNNYKTVITEISGATATVYLNRPDVHNSMNDVLINELFDVFSKLNTLGYIRVIVLTGIGKSFCSGADLNWMKDIVKYSYQQNLEESLKLARLMLLINTHSKPVIAKVNGPAFGGGIGLLAACDFVIAVNNATFAFTEVKLGLAPAVISPFIINRLGKSKARELFLSGAKFDSNEAFAWGLANKIVDENELDTAVGNLAETLINNSPNAIKTIKTMMFDYDNKVFPELTEYTAGVIAGLRVSAEGQSGMNSFLEKRKPIWKL